MTNLITMREPLNSMTTAERCRFFAKFYGTMFETSPGFGPGMTEWEEMHVLNDAANELEDLQRSYQVLLDMVAGKTVEEAVT